MANRMSQWFHVTPLFLLPHIFERGGLACGADVDTQGLHRRQSSREFDDRALDGLDGKRVADFILLYRRRSHLNPLLLNKIRGHRDGRPWRSYPHVVLVFDADACLNLAGDWVWAASANVGRTLGNGGEPHFGLYCEQESMQTDAVQEIFILAEKLPGRVLPLTALESIETFSESDRQMILSLQGAQQDIDVVLSDATQRVKNYTFGQSQPPGSDFLALQQKLFAAISNGDEETRDSLIARLANECFD